ncbi:MAG: amidohydrolase family protein [Acidimicrobiales bacterium]|nr:amidohydrolase family protein [Acidimicrobiales bacterium]
MADTTHDLVVRGGRVYDGSGRAAVSADVAVDGETITTVGEVAGRGRTEIDATGLDVTPGFVDLHTHLDAQIGWDPLMTPITHHGVTTALLGNCGVTFAPCRADDRATLAGWMESVEDIPAPAILGGLPWSWEGYGGYLDALEGLRPAVNATGLVGHSAVRLYVMGENAVDGQPTETEIAQMAEVVGQSIAEGALGFSTSRLLGHKVPDGRCVPGTHAEMHEIEAIAAAISEAGGGLFQNVLNIENLPHEFEMLKRQGSHAGVRVMFSTGVGADPGSGHWMRQQIESLAASGVDVTGICTPRASGLVVGLYNIMPFKGKAWIEMYGLDFEGRLAAVRDPAMRARLVDECDGAMWEPERMFWMGAGETPNYVGGPEASLAGLAEAAGESPVECFLRLADEADGRVLFTLRIFNPSIEALEVLLGSEFVLPSLGDAGAHVGQIMDAGWTSFVLSHWVRTKHVYTEAEAIRRMTAEPARILGLDDRGRVAPGMGADLNVLDLETVSEQFPTFVHDFPGGHGRFQQKSNGYTATVCNGELITTTDGHTGNRAGQVLRRATPTP